MNPTARATRQAAPMFLDTLPAGRTRTIDDAARLIEAVAERLDAYAALAELDVAPPGLAALDSARLLRSVAGFIRQPRRPVRWESELSGTDELLRTLLAASARMLEVGETVTGLHVKVLRVLLCDLAATLGTVAPDPPRGPQSEA